MNRAPQVKLRLQEEEQGGEEEEEFGVFDFVPDLTINSGMLFSCLWSLVSSVLLFSNSMPLLPSIRVSSSLFCF